MTTLGMMHIIGIHGRLRKDKDSFKKCKDFFIVTRSYRNFFIQGYSVSDFLLVTHWLALDASALCIF